MFSFFTNRGKLFLVFFVPFIAINRLINFRTVFLNKISSVNFYQFILQFYVILSNVSFIKSIIFHHKYSNFVDFYRGCFFNYITLRVNQEFNTIISTHLEPNSNFTNFKINL